jgi:hypothetical protein
MEENEFKQTKERAKFFQTVQAWPLSAELNYSGWLKNFTTPADKKVAAHILDFFTYLPQSLVKQMLRTSVGKAGHKIKKHFSDWKHSDFKTRCYYSAIPGENPNLSDSGNYFTRILCDLEIPEDRIINYDDIPATLANNLEPSPLIFVDDFVGSGNQIVKAWNENVFPNGKYLKQIAIEGKHLFIYAPLIVNEIGYKRIKSDCPGLFLSTNHVLGEEYNLFNPKCYCWKNDPTLFSEGVELILRKSGELGIPSTHGISMQDEKGFVAQGLALKFSHGAPDAVPAFFYWKHDNWIPLFAKSY